MNLLTYRIFSVLVFLSITAPALGGYTPSANVEAGHRISGESFSTEPAYLTKVLTTPIALTVMGFLSIIVLNISFCCRKCFKCCRCEPNDHHNEKGHDHDSVSKRVSYINHQKLMVFIVEMVLCFCVMLADMFCFYGYTGIVAGGEDLNEALDLINALLTNAVGGATAVQGTTAKIDAKILSSRTLACPPQSAGDAMDQAYDGLALLSTLTATAMQVVIDGLGPMKSNVADTKDYINDYLIGYADIFVFLVFSFAFVSVVLFVVFRLFRSQCGTKIAIAWGMLTFIILLLVCLPFMIFSSIFGDFCMDPSVNAVAQAPDSVKAKLTFYSTCVGVDEVGDNLRSGKTNLQTIITDITTALTCNACKCINQTAGTSNVDLLGAPGNPGIKQYADALGANLQLIIDAAGCPKVQTIWFKIVNDALCTNFYSGIYSLWVSQFVTSFFLFLLIVVASISYHYFAKSTVYVSTEGAPEVAEKRSLPVESAVEMQKLNTDYGDSDA